VSSAAELSREWRERNPGRVREYEAQRKAKKAQANVGKVLRGRWTVDNPQYSLTNPCGVSCFECPHMDCVVDEPLMKATEWNRKHRDKKRGDDAAAIKD
jgi:hypothetical protein